MEEGDLVVLDCATVMVFRGRLRRLMTHGGIDPGRRNPIPALRSTLLPEMLRGDVPERPGRTVLDAFVGGDSAIVVGCLAPDATFHSPVADYNGSEEIARILAALAQVLRAPAPVSVHSTVAETICFFTAAVAGRRGDGVLRIVAHRDEPVTELTFMIRPLETPIAGVKAMERVLRSNPA